MKFWLGLTAILFSTTLSAETIVLSEKNTVVINTPIFGELIAPQEQELLNLNAKLPPGQPIYLFMDTPGGSITDGMEFIALAKSLNREVKTITKFSASMGFIMVQALGERLIMPSGVLMSHRAFAQIKGNSPGELETRLAFIQSYNNEVDAIMGTRLGLTPAEVLQMNIYEYWVLGKEAVKDGTADRIVNVSCDKSMSGTKMLKVYTLFGPVSVTYSKCPLISTPLGVEFNGINVNTLPERERKILEFLLNGTPTNNNTFDFTNIKRIK